MRYAERGPYTHLQHTLVHTPTYNTHPETQMALFAFTETLIIDKWLCCGAGGFFQLRGAYFTETLIIDNCLH